MCLLQKVVPTYDQIKAEAAKKTDRTISMPAELDRL